MNNVGSGHGIRAGMCCWELEGRAFGTVWSGAMSSREGQVLPSLLNCLFQPTNFLAFTLPLSP